MALSGPRRVRWAVLRVAQPARPEISELRQARWAVLPAVQPVQPVRPVISAHRQDRPPAQSARTADADAKPIVYDFSRELHETKGVSDANYKRVLDRFGERGVFDLIAVNGYYSLVSMCLNVDRTPLPDGVPPPLK